MTHTQTNSQALEPDEQVSFRLVEIDRVPYWQASSGRTFPRIAGGEDPPADEHSDQDTEHDDDSAGGAEVDPQIARLRRDAARYRTELRQAQAQLDTLKAEDQRRKDADKTEAERLKEQLAEATRKSEQAERELQDTRNRQAIERAAVKAGAADADDVFRLLDPTDFQRDEAGKLTNADDLVKALLKAKPYLAGKSGTSGVPPTPRSNGQPAGHDDRVDEAKKKLIASGNYEPL